MLHPHRDVEPIEDGWRRDPGVQAGQARLIVSAEKRRVRGSGKREINQSVRKAILYDDVTGVRQCLRNPATIWASMGT